MGSTRPAPSCTPTWKGHIETTNDAMMIFEACLQGLLSHCIRRPHDRERNNLIVSGNVFVYEEGTSGIKRWTDGIPWSPSRILTNFLIYRQLNSPFPPGEKKRATKRSQRPVKPGEPYPAPMPNGNSNGNDDLYSLTGASPTAPGIKYDDSMEKDADRVLVGSLVDSYEFKEGGLLKKTMTVSVNGVQHHLVSYYSLEDAKHRLETPRLDPALKDIQMREELLNQPKFKVANFDDPGDGTYDQADNPPTYPYLSTNIPTMRPFAAPMHGQFSPQDQSPHVYWPNYTPYASHVHTPTSISNVSFASMPSTPSAYTPILSTLTGYPQYPNQTQNHNHNPQPQRQNSSQSIIKTEGQSQYQSQIQQQPQFQSNSQFRHYPQQETKPSLQASFQHQSPTSTAVRGGGGMGFFQNGHDPLGINNSYYTQGVNVGASLNDASLLLPQPMQLSFSAQYGASSDGNYYSSRTSS